MSRLPKKANRKTLEMCAQVQSASSAVIFAVLPKKVLIFVDELNKYARNERLAAH